jgi:hypothetical protein
MGTPVKAFVPAAALLVVVLLSAVYLLGCGDPILGRIEKEMAKTSTLTVTQPNGGESYCPGQAVEITWAASESAGEIRIELLRGGASAAIIIDKATNSGSYTWTVPPGQADGADYRVSVARVDAPELTDQSDSDFSIGNIVVTSPNGGEALAVGGACAITWVSNYPGTVTIELGKAGSWTAIATGEQNDGSYTWSPVSAAGGTDYRIRVRSESSAFADESNGDFGIVVDNLQVTAPAGGTVVGAGGNLDIAWTGVASGNVKIELFKGAGTTPVSTVTASTPNDGSFSWSIPANQAVGADYKIRVSTLTAPSFFRDSGLFTIEILAITSPAGGSIIEQGAARSITWSSSGNGFVKIELFKGANPAPVTTLSSSTANSGTFNWTPTQSPAADYRLRVTSLAVPTLFSETTAFTIEKIAVSAPGGGQLFAVGSTCTVYWSSSGAGSVDIILYQGGTPVTTVASTPNDGDYTWTFGTGLAAGTSYKFRVRRTDATGVFAEGTLFAVEKITLSSPNGGSLYNAGSPCPITWTGSGVGTVKIELYKDGVLDELLVSSTANSGSYAWTIAGAKTAGWKYRVRITHTVVSSLDDSDNNFIISHWTSLGKPTTTRSDQPAIAVGSDNKPVLVYRDYAYGAYTAARPVGKKWSSGTSWTDYGVAFLDVPDYLQIDLRADGRPVIGARSVTVQYPVCDYWNSGLNWTSYGMPLGNAADALYLALAVRTDNNWPIMAFTESSTSRILVKTGTTSPWATSMGYLTAAGNAGLLCTMDMGSDNLPVAAFVEYVASPEAYNVRVRKFVSGTTWTDYGTLSTYGMYPHVALDPADGKPLVIYFDYPSGTATANVVVKKWSSGTTWTNYGTLDSGTLFNCDIVVAANGLVMAAYRDGTYEIKVKIWQGGTTWADLGYISSNMSVDPQLAVGPDNQPVIAFTDNLANDQDNVQIFKWQ